MQKNKVLCIVKFIGDRGLSTKISALAVSAI